MTWTSAGRASHGAGGFGRGVTLVRAGASD